MNTKQLGTSFLAAAALTGMLSGLALADDTATSGASTGTDSTSTAPAGKTSGKKHKKGKASCNSKKGCSAKK